jgi:hypothetical protein
MTAYVKRNAVKGFSKQHDRLWNMERLLQLRIESRSSAEEISIAVENVRRGALQVIKAIQHDLEPARAEDLTDLRQRQLALLRETASEWERLTAEEISRRYS